MSSSIVLPRYFQESKLEFVTAKMKTMETGMKIIPVSYDGRPLVFQTPEMSSPFGVSKFYPKDKDGNVIEGVDPSNVTIEVAFKNMDTKPKVEALFNAMSAYDTKAKREAGVNSMQWFKKKLSEEGVNLMYSNTVRIPTDKETGEPTDKWPPTFRMKIPFKNGKYGIDFYSKDRVKYDNANIDELLSKGVKVSAIVQCMGVWIAGKGCGTTWKVVQMVVSPPEKLRGFAFVNDGEEDGDEGSEENLAEEEDDEVKHGSDSEAHAPASSKPAASSAPAQLADSDSDEDDDDEPAPVLTKKTTVARKTKK